MITWLESQVRLSYLYPPTLPVSPDTYTASVAVHTGHKDMFSDDEVEFVFNMWVEAPLHICRRSVSIGQGEDHLHDAGRSPTMHVTMNSAVEQAQSEI